MQFVADALNIGLILVKDLNAEYDLCAVFCCLVSAHERMQTEICGYLKGGKPPESEVLAH